VPSLKSKIGKNEHISLDDVCLLISVTTTKDELGQPIETETHRQIFCSKLSVNRAEFLAAGQLDHKPQMTLLVDSDEYDGEKSLRYDKHGNLTEESEKYHVYRDFMRDDGFTELYCEVRAGG
jgi:hypothetical protein